MSIDCLSPLALRTIVSAVAIVAIYFAVSYSYTPTGMLVVPIIIAGISSLAAAEYYALAFLQSYEPKKTVGIVSIITYVASVFFATFDPLFEFLPNVIISVCLMAIFLFYFRKGNKPFASCAISLFPLMYIALPLCFLIRINYHLFPHFLEPQDGRVWLLYLFIITYTTDSCALFVGKMAGKRKLAPIISPHKTWEGAIGGLVMATVASVAFHYLSQEQLAFLPMRLSLFHSIALGVCLAALAQIGDLAESLLKRNAGQKDSGYIPGLGGFLDTVDSLLFTAPALYLYLKCI